MTYSIVAIIAIAIILIINAGIIFVKSTKTFAPATKIYRFFLFALIAFLEEDAEQASRAYLQGWSPS